MYRPDLRHWKEAQLDLSLQPEAFKAWQLRAMRMLSEDRPDVQRLLEWAEAQGAAIDSNAAQLGARAVNFPHCEDVPAISIKILNVLTAMVANSLIPSTQACGTGHGLELWRSLAARWHGQSQQVLAATLAAFLTPKRCARIEDLWDALPVWEAKGTTLLLAREPVSPMLKYQGLSNLIPQKTLNDIIGRPDLTTFDALHAFVRGHMEHSRGYNQSRSATLNSCAVTSDETWDGTSDELTSWGPHWDQFLCYMKGKGKSSKGSCKSGPKGIN